MFVDPSVVLFFMKEGITLIVALSYSKCCVFKSKNYKTLVKYTCQGRTTISYYSFLFPFVLVLNNFMSFVLIDSHVLACFHFPF